MKNVFEYWWELEMCEPNNWNPDENIFLKLLKPFLSLLKNNLNLKKNLRHVLNSSKTWTRRVFKNPDNRPALVITKSKKSPNWEIQEIEEDVPNEVPMGRLKGRQEP